MRYWMSIELSLNFIFFGYSICPRLPWIPGTMEYLVIAVSDRNASVIPLRRPRCFCMDNFGMLMDSIDSYLERVDLILPKKTSANPTSYQLTKEKSKINFTSPSKNHLWSTDMYYSPIFRHFQSIRTQLIEWMLQWNVLKCKLLNCCIHWLVMFCLWFWHVISTIQKQIMELKQSNEKCGCTFNWCFIWKWIEYHDVYLNLINACRCYCWIFWLILCEQWTRCSYYLPSFAFCLSRFLTRSVYCKYSARLANVSCLRMNACVPLLKSDNDFRKSLLIFSWLSSGIMESEISP